MSTTFDAELAELRLQVEVMALRADRSVELALDVLRTGDAEVARSLIDSDDEIDAMHVSLTERCYEMLVRFQPVASDLRLVVSVIRVLGALERIGNLSLRIAHLVEDQPVLAGHPGVYRVVLDLGDNVHERFRLVQKAWSTNDLSILDELDRTESLETFANPLVERILDLEGTDAVRVAMAAFVAGRSLDRIGDHSQVMAIRLRYLATGDAAFLAEEVGG